MLSSLLKLKTLNSDKPFNTIKLDCVIWHIQDNQPEFSIEPNFPNSHEYNYCELRNHNRIVNDIGHTKSRKCVLRRDMKLAS